MIWAVASGKGGVGKSIVSANLAAAFAERRRRCVLVDLDLGCANQHSFFDLPAGRPGLAHFLRGDVSSLGEAAVPSAIPNLSLISGDRAAPDAANPAHARKRKLLRALRELDADDVILDLGAGTSFNVLDFFLGADRRLLVAVPEPTSLENTVHFLTASFFRMLRQLPQQQSVSHALAHVNENRGAALVRPCDLLDALEIVDPAARVEFDLQRRLFRPSLIVNQASIAPHRSLGERLAEEWRENGLVELRSATSLPRDVCVLESVAQRTIAQQHYPGSPFARELEVLAEEFVNSVDPVHAAKPRIAEAADLLDERMPLPAVDYSEPGRSLALRREALGLSQDEVVARTRISCAGRIEREEFEELPPPSYLRRFVEQLATSLEIEEPERLAAEYLERCERATQLEEKPDPPLAPAAESTSPPLELAERFEAERQPLLQECDEDSIALSDARPMSVASLAGAQRRRRRARRSRR